LPQNVCAAREDCLLACHYSGTAKEIGLYTEAIQNILTEYFTCSNTCKFVNTYCKAFCTVHSHQRTTFVVKRSKKNGDDDDDDDDNNNNNNNT
jgi:hypothetical protein